MILVKYISQYQNKSLSFRNLKKLTKAFELSLTYDSLFVDLPDMKMIYCCHATYVLWMYDAWYGLDFLRVFPGTIIKTFTNAKTFSTVWTICPLGLKLENRYWTYLIDLRPILGPPQFLLSLLCPPMITLECLIKIGRVSRKWEERQNIQSEMKYLSIVKCAKIWKCVML